MKVLFLDIDGVLNSENWFGYVQYCIKNDMYNRVLNFVDIDNEHIIARDVEYVPISCTDEDGNVIWTLNEEC